MRAERHTALRYSAKLAERHDLEAAGIGQDRPVPAHETMQAAKPRDALRAWTQHQVIGIAEDDIGTGPLHVLGKNGLNGRRCADGHEGGGADRAAGR